MRPDAVRAGDEDTERLLRRAFGVGYCHAHADEGESVPEDEGLEDAYEEWRRGLLTREVPSLSLSQINELTSAVGFARQYLGGEKADALHDALDRLRAELTREDGRA